MHAAPPILLLKAHLEFLEVVHKQLRQVAQV
jgi:hypothetical protein